MEQLQGLNEPQREAVLHEEGPLLIIAGAGSGKTRVLTYRIANLMAQGVDPFRILALTFTNKAAKEMRERIEKVVGTDARSLWMGTFHSVFAKILRSEADKIGYPSNFTIYDTQDTKSLIKAIVKEQGLDDKIYKPGAVYNRISGAKNRLISWQEYNGNINYRADDEAANMPQMGKLYQIYSERCFKAGAMDFDDLLFNTNVLFRDRPDVLHKYQHRFLHVMVDEFQDTNYSQYLITKKLAAVHRNICVVGDDAQSIYSFRGADISNILNLEKDYDDLRIIKLEQNYRSTKVIVAAANGVIKNNKAQLRKEVFTDNEQGEGINLIKAGTDQEEARLVASSLFEYKMHGHLRNTDFAILYRTNAQSRTFEEALRKMNIKYRIVGGLSFYQRKEIKDLLAYMRYTLNKNDEEALKRIINYPKRGIGDTSIANLIVFANESGKSLWEVISNINQFGNSGRMNVAIDTFATIIKSFEAIATTKDAFETAQHIAKQSGILRELYEDKTPEGLARYENIQELLNAVKEFTDNPDIEDKSLTAFLQDVSLMTDADKDDDGDDDKVTLMTIHASKGLEFKHVFIVGLEEDLFPSQMMLESREDLEEERRLFYVALTRAEKQLHLSYALSRYRFGRLKTCEPSRFLEEVDVRYLKVSNKAPEPESSGLGGRLKSQMLAQQALRNQMATDRKDTVPVSPDFKASPAHMLAQGQRVEHTKFGMGTINEIEAQGLDKKARIHFDHFGEKTLLLSFAKLMIREQ